MEEVSDQTADELPFSKAHSNYEICSSPAGGKPESVVNSWLSALLPPQWLEWHPCAPVLLAGTDDGNVWMWKIPSGDCKTFQSSACQATSGKVLPDGERSSNPQKSRRAK